MHSFKKILVSILSFLLAVILISSIVIYTLFNTSYWYVQDLEIRNNLAGKINCAFIGTSWGDSAIVSNIFDKKCNSFSYNFCSTGMSPSGKVVLLREEITRNPINKVFICVDNTDFTFEPESRGLEGNAMTITRLVNTKDRIQFFFDTVNVKDYNTIYGIFLNRGFYAIGKLMQGDNKPALDSKNKGFYPREPNDVTIETKKIKKSYNSFDHATHINKSSYQQLVLLVQLCKENNISCTLIMTPISDAQIWETKGLDKIHQQFVEFSNKYSVEFWDFNLLKEKNNFLDDSFSFNDFDHMSEPGAIAFTNSFCDIINHYHSYQKARNLFFNSYDEVKKNSKYYKLLSTKKSNDF